MDKAPATISPGAVGPALAAHGWEIHIGHEVPHPSPTFGSPMHTDLLRLDVRKRPAKLRFDGRILFLVDDAELMRRQLEGEDLELTEELRAKLRDQISTDEITPAYICYYFDETLGQFPYLGLQGRRRVPGQARKREEGRLRLLGERQAAGEGTARGSSRPTRS